MHEEAVENEDTDERRKCWGESRYGLKPMNCEEGLADPDKVVNKFLDRDLERRGIRGKARAVGEWTKALRKTLIRVGELPPVIMEEASRCTEKCNLRRLVKGREFSIERYLCSSANAAMREEICLATTRRSFLQQG